MPELVKKTTETLEGYTLWERAGLEYGADIEYVAT
jgi:hypothetical protein